MGFIIESGGVAANKAIVDDKGRLEVAAIAETAIQEATDDGDAYSLTSVYSATGGQEVLSIQNDSITQHMHFAALILSADAATRWDLFEVTSGTPAGTTATVNNLNLTSGKAFSSRGTAFGDASVTGSLTGNRLLSLYTAANAAKQIPLLGAVRLDQGDKIALTVVTTSVIAVTVIFFYA